MAADPHAPLDIEALADAREPLAGRLDAAAFHRRLAEALAMDRTEGEVVYELEVEHLAGGAIGVSGRLRARLVARCQRCLEPFELGLTLAPRLAFSTADRAPVGDDDWELAEAQAPSSLAVLIEDELLLGLPFAPAHPPDACPAGVGAPAARSDTQRPFAGLGAALKDRRAGD